jgi:hypothetical protein
MLRGGGGGNDDARFDSSPCVLPNYNGGGGSVYIRTTSIANETNERFVSIRDEN